MNAKTLFAAAALALVGTASFADEVRDYPTPSTLTRAEVKAELLRAQAAGETVAHLDTYGQKEQMRVPARGNTVVASLNRVEVRRELALAARNSATIQGESYGSFAPTVASVRSRDEVRAEAIAAMRSRFTSPELGGH